VVNCSKLLRHVRKKVCPRVNATVVYRQHVYALSSGKSAKYCDLRVRMYVSLSVCPLACISQKSHVQTSRNFVYMLPVAVARSFFDDNAICYVFPALWITSCFHMRQIQLHVIGKLLTVTCQVAPRPMKSSELSMVKTASLYDNFCKTGNYVIYDVIIWVQDGSCKNGSREF